jgi:predicted metal-dependent peptidase
MAISKTVQQAIFYLLQENAFIGNLLQELDIKMCDSVPTAALRYDKDDLKFEVLLNEKFFNSLSLEHRVNVFHHELLHFTHGHMFQV